MNGAAGFTRRQWLGMAALAAAWPAAEALRPRRRTADAKPRIDLEGQLPPVFGDWHVDAAVQPLLPDPSLQSQLDRTYTQVLARTYRGRGDDEAVMLTIAYGNDQASEATAVHRPEFCYRAQGFEVARLGAHRIDVGSSAPLAQRLVAVYGARVEPISYWVTLDEIATLPGLGRKLQQLRFGLAGWIADGMLVRISSFGAPDAGTFALHGRFARALAAAMDPSVRRRYFGSDPGAGGHA